MIAHTDKTSDNKSKAAANSVTKQQANTSAMQLQDNRSEAKVQAELQEMANSSSQVSQLRVYQEMANNSIQIKQLKENSSTPGNSNVVQRTAQSFIEMWAQVSGAALSEQLIAIIDQSDSWTDFVALLPWNGPTNDKLKLLKDAYHAPPSAREKLIHAANVIYNETTHSGQPPELTGNKKKLYESIKARDLSAAKGYLQSVNISCREGVLILSLISTNNAEKLDAFLAILLRDGHGAAGGLAGSPFEAFLGEEVFRADAPWKGEPKVGSAINILGTTHSVVYVGNNEVISLNGGGKFTLVKLQDEINDLLASDADSVREMLKNWLMFPGAPERLKAKGEEDAFLTYVYEGPSVAATNTKYIRDYEIASPKYCCTISTQLLDKLT